MNEHLTKGVVVDNVDPQAIHRVQVTRPAFGDTTTWAPVASFFASHEAGASFIPAIGDEVLVAHLDGDLKQPVVIGSIFSKTNPPPPGMNEDPSVRGIRTAGGSEIRFDDHNSTVTIRSSAGATVALSHAEIVIEDAFGNTAKLLKSGVRIESSGSLTVESATDLNLRSSTDVDVKADRNVKLAASATAEIEGVAAARVSSSGTTSVTGAMVMIN